MSEIIPKDELPKWLKKVPEWDYENKCISRSFDFDEFVEGIDFVNDVAEIAEEASHHPDIDIRGARVLCSLTTHDKNGVTELDIEIAARIDTLVD